MNDEIKIIAEPSLVSEADAKQVLDEISAVLRKHGCIIRHTAEAIELGKLIGPMKALGMAKTKLITPDIHVTAYSSWGSHPALTSKVKH